MSDQNVIRHFMINKKLMRVIKLVEHCVSLLNKEVIKVVLLLCNVDNRVVTCEGTGDDGNSDCLD